MKVDKICREFNEAMADIRFAFWSMTDEPYRKDLGNGIMRLEDLIDPLWKILKKAKESEIT